MPRLLFTLLAAGTILGMAACTTPDAPVALSAPRGQGVEISPAGDRLQVRIEGALFTEYHFTNVPKPFCYPVLGPGQAPMTRNFPMKDTPGEEHDHPHHRSLWFTHGDVNGHDFWLEKPASGRIVHEAFLDIESGDKSGHFTASNRWVTSQGQLVCTDRRTLRFAQNAQGQRLLDFDIEIFAPEADLVFGDTKEGTMAMRVAESLRVTRPAQPGQRRGAGQGHLLNREGARNGEVWGKRAAWCASYGPVQGRAVGVAMFDHPANPSHPTWWHARDYGLFAANPFGKHDFEALSDKRAGDLKIPQGGSVRFRYRFVFFMGAPAQAGLDALYEAYAETATEND